jgi:23S rRNA pseudouridine1911/1915/1917 synthase
MTHFDIIYQDNHLLAANKVTGLLTQDSGLEEVSLEQQAREWVAKAKNKPGAAYVHAVHRLDRSVSGVVLFARTSKALTRLQTSMRDGKVTRIYHAMVLRPPPQESATLTNWLLHRHHFSEVVTKQLKGATKAVLDYRLIGKVGKRFVLEVTLHTGRYHQIRSQLAAAGMPIIGDHRYGGTERIDGTGIGLHSRILSFPHPIGAVPTTLEAPYPRLWPRP